MRKKIVITKLLQSLTEVYYEVCQVLQSASVIKKHDSQLLQAVSGVAKCDDYFQVRRNTFTQSNSMSAVLKIF